MTRYIEALPEGLASHPHARGKASLYRSLLDDAVQDAAAASDLPEPVARMFSAPIPVSTWIPETHSNAALLAIQELSGLDAGEHAAMVRARMRALYDGPLYRILFRLASPGLLLRTAAYRWGSFHRGSNFVLESSSSNEAVVRVDYPPHLWNETLGRGLAAGIVPTLELCGAADVTIDLVESTPTAMRLHGRWR